MHFTQPATKCRIWPWNSQGSPFRGSIILGLFRTLINGLAAKLLALNIVVMPHVHRAASLFDRWWLGIHQGAIRWQHLDYYLDEFIFRFNRRPSNARGLLFFRLMEQAVDCSPVPRKIIIGGRSQNMVAG
jgi:hypothetical protein